MSLRVIDAASHQGDMAQKNMDFDALIVKATEGCSYINPYCDSEFQEAMSLGKKLGVYHFARNAEGNSAEAEAEFFISNTLGYIKKAIPILDWEAMALWQWTSVGRLNGHNGNLDCSIFYGDSETWDKYVGSQETQEETDTTPQADKYKVGDHVIFSTCYKSSSDPNSAAIPAAAMLQNHGIITYIQVYRKVQKIRIY